MGLVFPSDRSRLLSSTSISAAETTSPFDRGRSQKTHEEQDSARTRHRPTALSASNARIIHGAGTALQRARIEGRLAKEQVWSGDPSGLHSADYRFDPESTSSPLTREELSQIEQMGGRLVTSTPDYARFETYSAEDSSRIVRFLAGRNNELRNLDYESYRRRTGRDWKRIIEVRRKVGW